VRLARALLLTASITVQLLKQIFSKLIEEIDQGKNEESGSRL
jgi:hypothetical protein